MKLLEQEEKFEKEIIQAMTTKKIRDA